MDLFAEVPGALSVESRISSCSHLQLCTTFCGSRRTWESGQLQGTSYVVLCGNDAWATTTQSSEKGACWREDLFRWWPGRRS